jgi:hypothetical protein
MYSMWLLLELSLEECNKLFVNTDNAFDVQTIADQKGQVQDE